MKFQGFIWTGHLQSARRFPSVSTMTNKTQILTSVKDYLLANSATWSTFPQPPPDLNWKTFSVTTADYLKYPYIFYSGLSQCFLKSPRAHDWLKHIWERPYGICALTTASSPHLIKCNDAICLIWRLPLNVDLLFKRSSLDGFQGNGSRNYRKKE